MESRKVTDLAIFGGKPTFSSPLYVGRPNIGCRDQLNKRFNEILDRNWLTNYGPCVKELEQKIAQMLGVNHCILMANATVALEIVIKALELKGEVIIPSYTFVATAHALQWQEISPIFCDINPITHNIDPKQIETLITAKTSGIIGVHLWGRPCEVEALQNIAHNHSLKLVFDAAHAFGCSYNSRMIGNFGNAEVFSFHATKFLNTFEGGAVTTNDDALAQKIRLMKNFGFAGFDQVIYIGTNGKMNEFSAAMGLTSLEHIDQFIETNHYNYNVYKKELANVSGLSVIDYNPSDKNNYHYIITEIDSSLTGVSRDNILKALHAENIIARRYFFPGCHNMEPYRSESLHKNCYLPNTDKLNEKVLCLPNGTAMNSESIKQVCDIIKIIINNPSKFQSL